jgi:hypothetical protein
MERLLETLKAIDLAVKARGSEPADGSVPAVGAVVRNPR